MTQEEARAMEQFLESLPKHEEKSVIMFDGVRVYVSPIENSMTFAIETNPLMWFLGIPYYRDQLRSKLAQKIANVKNPVSDFDKNEWNNAIKRHFLDRNIHATKIGELRKVIRDMILDARNDRIKGNQRGLKCDEMWLSEPSLFGDDPVPAIMLTLLSDTFGFVTYGVLDMDKCEDILHRMQC